jgi:predicted alpha/beta-fold hydrolase
MTIASNFWPRRTPGLGPSVPRDFATEPGTHVRGACHWQPNPQSHPTLVIVHGLEGSSESGYSRGTAEKAWVAGFNVIRLNQRNCGGTEKLTTTLYHSGLSIDILSVVAELIERDGLPEIFTAGYSMGGNLVLKMAGELGDAAPDRFRGCVAIAPALDLASCANALERRDNFIYQRHFVRRLRRRMTYKASLYPEIYPSADLKDLAAIKTVRGFDDAITAHFCGFDSADHYYETSSALRVVADIRRPTLIIAAKDDPFVPFAPFDDPAIRNNPFISVVAPEHGGHCAFISAESGDERFWAEARLVEFCRAKSLLAGE